MQQARQARPSPPTLIAAAAALLVAAAPARARAADEHEHHAVESAAESLAAPDPAQMPYAVPRQTLIPGTPGMAGGYHLMVNGFGFIENQGLGATAITNPGVATGFEGGATRALLQHDWVMGYGRDERGASRVC